MSGSRTRSVVLLSGGLDSAANLAFCVEQDEPVLALTANYGQRAAQAELRAAQAICKFYQIPHQTLDVSWLGRLGGSSLTDTTQNIPELLSTELDDRGITEGSAKSVWVPNRNGVLINIAAAFGEQLKANQVVVGFNREEAATFPDNSAEFLKRASASLEYSTSNHARVACYTVNLDKKEIVRKLRALDRQFPFELLWSCYHGGEKPCGGCESCRRLARALEAGEQVQSEGL